MSIEFEVFPFNHKDVGAEKDGGDNSIPSMR